MSQRIVTPEARLSYPALDKPKPNMSGNKEEFSVMLAWPKSADLSKLRNALLDAIKEKWGPDKSKWPGILKTQDLTQYLSPTGQDGWPLRDGDAMGKPEFEGMVTVNAKSPADRRPRVVDKDVQPILDFGEVYGGCYVKVSVNAFAYEFKAENGGIKRGVSFGLGNVQKTRDGEPFGAGNVKPEDEFTPVESDDDL